MRMLAIILFVFVMPTALHAQEPDCTPLGELIFVYWGNYAEEHIPETSATSGWATDLVWVQSATGSIEVPQGVTLPLGDYTLLDDTRCTAAQGCGGAEGSAWYYTGIEKGESTNTTPVVVRRAGYWVLPGHRLSLRSSITLPGNVRLGIHATGLRYPAACAGRLHFPPIAEGGGQSVDLGPIRERAAALSAEIAALIALIPPP